MNKSTKSKKFSDHSTKTDYSIRRSRSKYGLSRKPPPRMYGAVDLGTNNCRLLIARPSGQGFRVTTSYSRIVRLGEGLSENGYLSDSAMDRTIVALTTCSEKLKSFSVIKSRSIATEACRRAKNCDDFLARIENRIGLRMETITSNEEARLALRGCQNLLNPTQPYALVFDIGGGSTEIIWAKRGIKNFDILDVLSLPLGVVTLAEEWATAGSNNDNYQEMRHYVALKLPIFCKRNNIKQKIKEKKVQMLATSGTVTTLGAVHLKLNYYDRSLIDGLNLTFEDLDHATKKLTEQNYLNRSKIPCIGDERAELVIPGCAILEAICKRWPVGKLRVADRGLREGILLELMFEDGIPVTGNPTANDQKSEII